MNASQKSVVEEIGNHDRRFQAAFATVMAARRRHVRVRPHRAITPLTLTPWLALQATVLPLLLCSLLWFGKGELLDFWRQVILFWSPRLGLPFELSTRINEAGQYALLLSPEGGAARLPGPLALLVTAALTACGLLLSLRMKNALLPLKYPLRIVCVVQLVTLGYFWLATTPFPYSVARHSEELMTIAYVVMLSTPVMLGVGYYVLNQRLVVKLWHTALILGFFAVMVPHQVLVQALIMQQLSVLFMPVLYICFGAVLDALVFVALYSWAVSNAPADATV